MGAHPSNVEVEGSKSSGVRSPTAGPTPSARRAETFLVFLRLGCTSFGGPIAHLGYFRAELVERRRWLDEAAYADLIALAQLLPGPTSSQVGFALGLHRAGWAGAALAWLGFTAPSALLLYAAACGIAWVGDVTTAGWMRGLQLAAVVIVVQAVTAMAAQFCTRLRTALLALATATVALLAPSSITTALLLLAAAAIADRSALWVKNPPPEATKRDSLPQPLALPYGRRAGGVFLSLFGLLLLGLPALSALLGNGPITELSRFYHAGALVFGGGHIVLPLLWETVVRPGGIPESSFLTGYGLAQAVPGPLFSVAAYLGAILPAGPNGWRGALLSLAAIYLPGMLILLAALPFWETVRRQARVRAALAGANAAVVGILLAALIRPVWSQAVQLPVDAAFVIALYLATTLCRLPSWATVLLAALAGQHLLSPN